MLVASKDVSEKRQTFFEVIFGKATGFLCIAFRESKPNAVFEEQFFKYPDKLPLALDYINTNVLKGDIWFSPMLFDVPRRSKATVISCPVAWADLDQCPPERMLVEPSLVIESSGGRYQALWRFKEPLEPYDAEDISRKIAYYHADDGADKSGWDLTQLLRVPFTVNYKYKDLPQPPVVSIIATSRDMYTIESFSEYPVPVEHAYDILPFPETLPENGDKDKVLNKHRLELPPEVWMLIANKPQADWSKDLWRLEMLLAESGLTREEIFTIVKDAACNKYKRDGRSEKLLWREVCKAYSRNSYQAAELYGTIEVDLAPVILSDAQRELIKDYHSFIDDYYDWASSLGDAAKQYHIAGAFTILSSLLGGNVRLPTSFGTILPNLWFMILADTTLTRKSTAMDIAVDLLNEVDTDALLATDGSIEGLLTALSMRPGRPSLFLRDEFSGLLEQMAKKDYYAGMGETLTKLYDGKFQKRILRKEVLEVREPILIILAGGIKSRIQELLTREHVSSGFLPRFIFITAESDTSAMKPLGPPTEVTSKERDNLVEYLLRLHSHYVADQIVTVNGKAVVKKKNFEAKLTPEAWQVYNLFEHQLLSGAINAYQREMLTPSVDRLAKSGLKAAVLLAAARKMESEVVVEEIDILKAFSYVELWAEYMIDVLRNIGKSISERKISMIFDAIKKVNFTTRSQLMRTYHLTKYEADMVFDTLDQRGLITRVRVGKTERVSAITG